MLHTSWYLKLRCKSVAWLFLVIAGALFASCALPAGSGNGYEAEIRRTSHGIPHIVAKDIGSLGFGEGYAFAQDHLCSLADQVIKARGERAKYMGAGEKDQHLSNDVGYRALDIYERAEKVYAAMPAEQQEWLKGYAAGYNTYLRETGVDGVSGWCRGQQWVFEINPVDLTAYRLAVVMTGTNFAAMIATAAPPKDEGTPVSQVDFPHMDQASNGWAVGSERSESGRGMLIANPHYPWVGSNRFWEKHLTIPGELNVYGVGLLGSPGVAIGFNDAVAWTHTVSAGKRYTLYTLNLVPGNPTRYYYDGKERELTSKVVSVEVRQADGTLKREERRIFFSHYGPILNMPGFEWTAKQALTFRDANNDNTESQSQWLAMNRARSMAEFQQAHAKYNAMPWVNTMATSADGLAWYADNSATPNLSAEAIAAWTKARESDPATKKAWERGIVLLNGSDAKFEWVDDRETRAGVVPFSKEPHLEVRDFVFNANDSFWLANPRHLLTGYSPMHGLEKTARSLRTRMNVVLLDDKRPEGPAGKDGKFSLDELANAVFSNRSMAAELLRPELAARCQATSSVTIDGKQVDLKPACQILARWDGKFDLDSVGAVLWREFMSRYDVADLGRAGALFKVDFDPADPVNTPRGLAEAKDGKDLALENLARAVLTLQSANIALDTPLGKLQYSDRNGGRIPIHGGDGTYEGVANFVRYGPNTTTLEPAKRPAQVNGSRLLTVEGYPVNSGTSFVMALEYTDSGPHAKALLTYSESGDPASPLFYDQTELFSAKKWRPILFTDKEINEDRNLKVKKVTGARQ